MGISFSRARWRSSRARGFVFESERFFDATPRGHYHLLASWSLLACRSLLSAVVKKCSDGGQREWAASRGIDIAPAEGGSICYPTRLWEMVLSPYRDIHIETVAIRSAACCPPKVGCACPRSLIFALLIALDENYSDNSPSASLADPPALANGQYPP